MTQEEKELVLIDLSGRVRYGVRLWLKCFEKETKYFIDGHNILGSVVYDRGSEHKISLIDKGEYNIEGHSFSNYEQAIKPYLRSLSNMTEEERNELSDYLCEQVMSNKIGITIPPNPTQGKGIPFIWMGDCIDWLNAHHFDYRGLIEKGLALEAPEDMYQVN